MAAARSRMHALRRDDAARDEWFSIARLIGSFPARIAHPSSTRHCGRCGPAHRRRRARLHEGHRRCGCPCQHGRQGVSLEQQRDDRVAQRTDREESRHRCIVRAGNSAAYPIRWALVVTRSGKDEAGPRLLSGMPVGHSLCERMEPSLRQPRRRGASSRGAALASALLVRCARSRRGRTAVGRNSPIVKPLSLRASRSHDARKGHRSVLLRADARGTARCEHPSAS